MKKTQKRSVVSYPPELSVAALLTYVKSIHSEEEDFSVGDLTDRLIYKYKLYRLREIPITKIHSPWYTVYDRVCDFAEQKSGFPPIVLTPSLVVIDGNHRVKAAIARGDKTILAYVGAKS